MVVYILKLKLVYESVQIYIQLTVYLFQLFIDLNNSHPVS